MCVSVIGKKCFDCMIVFTFCLLLILPVRSVAQSDSMNGSDSESKEEKAWEITLASYFNAHFAEADYITQDQALGQEVILGIEEEVTVVGSAAVQLKAAKGRLACLARVEGEDGGISPLIDEFELAVAWCSYAVGSGFRVQGGRVEVPLGIFNQTRRVGSLHPFSRPADDFYRDGGFTLKGVDGVGISLEKQRFSSSLYWGSASFVEANLTTITTQEGDAKSVWGGQVALNLLADRLTLGIGYFQIGETEGGLLPSDQRDGTNVFVDWTAAKYFLRGEFRNLDIRLPSGGGELTFSPWYLEGGRTWRDLTFGLRYQQTDVTQDAPVLAHPSSFVQRETWTPSIAWDLPRGLRLKLEHNFHNFAFVDGIDFVPEGAIVIYSDEPSDSTILTLNFVGFRKIL